MSTRVCFGNWYHHDFYCAYNLIWFQRDHHIHPAFCSCFTNFLQMMSKWSSLLLDSGSSTPFLPCGYKAIHQKLFWDLPEIIHLSQFLILFFYGQEKPKKKKTFELQRYLMCGLEYSQSHFFPQTVQCVWSVITLSHPHNPGYQLVQWLDTQCFIFS